MHRFLVCSVGVLSVAMCSLSAQGQGFGRDYSNLYTPAPDARDLKAVLFNWTWHMGMLRGQAEPELVQTLEYRAVGTVTIDGQPCVLSEYVAAEPGVLGEAGYRISANYRIPGYRAHIECTLPNGETFSNIETMSGPYAWDEDIPGAGIVPGEGTATPRPGAHDERWIRLWASPHGAPKAALAAAAGVSVAEAFGLNPATLLDRQAAAGVESGTTLEWRDNHAILTFPIPELAGATATATLTEAFLPESVVVTHGDDTIEFEYANFQDFNNPLHRIEALYPATIIERRNGEVIRNLESVVTEIGQVYVVVPVPDSIRSGQ